MAFAWGHLIQTPYFTMTFPPFRIVCIAVLLLTPLLSRAAVTDTLVFGDAKSESAHALTASHSDTITGGLSQPARRLLPLQPPTWQGGTVSFVMKVNPDAPNYFTARFWGSDLNTNRMLLFCEGKQIGYRHLGDVDVLDTPNGSPAYAGRFYYNTCPLPTEMTKGKTQLHFEIRSNGEMWGYGTTFAQYQKPMTGPSRGIYAAYTHTDGYFAPPAGETQGTPPANPPVRTTPGPEILDQAKQRVNQEIAGMLKSRRPLNQQQLWYLARAYFVKWTPAYQNPMVVKAAVTGIDALYDACRQNPLLVQAGPGIYNNGWFGVGPAACAVVLLDKPLAPYLDGDISGAAKVSRRAGWAQIFAACRDWHRVNRRQYTNQTMIMDTYGIYYPNRAVAILAPDKALPGKAALRYLYEAAGIEPWRGSDRNVPGTEGFQRTDWHVGTNYYQLTNKSLTRELGYVGYYGEVLDWMTAMYDATRPAPGKPGDPKLKSALVKAAHARAFFRTPALDDDGYRAMRAETIVGWRDEDHYPADVTYAERPTWDASAIHCVAATLDLAEIGYAQQMFANNQFFKSVARQLQITSLRGTAALLDIPDDYETLKAQPPSTQRLPMSAGQPDFVFSDEEDGVVAVKHGQEILYASLYWRARTGVTGLARVHDTLPAFDRIAVVREDAQFVPYGLTYTRKDWVNMGFGNGGIRYPVDDHSAMAGEKIPIAKIPAGVPFKVGDESVYAGRASFYTLRYGPYVVGMNTTTGQTFDLKLPDGAHSVQELVSGRKDVQPGATVKVGPRSTQVYYMAY